MKLLTKVLSPALACAAFALSAPATAAPYRITFDADDPIGGLAAGTTLSDQYLGIGVSFSANAFSGSNTLSGNWATNTDMTVVSSKGKDVGTLGTPGLVSGNVLHSFTNYLNENGDASFAVNFASGVTSFSADFAGVNLIPSSAKLYGYNGSTLVASAIGSLTSGQFTLSLADATPMTRVVITPGSYDDWAAVDNISFNTAPPVAAVPEPATFAMFGIGIIPLLIAVKKSRSEQRRRPEFASLRV